MIHVVAAAIVNHQGQVLLSRRHVHAHQGGLWEFPGGKVEAGEDVSAALSRELHEELGIHIKNTRPLIAVEHVYPDLEVLLDVFLVDAWQGTPSGREQQVIEWVDVRALRKRDFPAANLPVVHALELPGYYLVTPDPAQAGDDFLLQLENSLQNATGMIQFRAPSLSIADYRQMAADVIALCRQQGIRVLVNTDVDLAAALGADGVHLNSKRLLACDERPLPSDSLVAASCHNAMEIEKAMSIGADFVVLSPVKRTRSHPQAAPLGWQQFAALCRESTVPVYALGGLAREDLEQAWQHGAQGIAGISTFWQPG